MYQFYLGGFLLPVAPGKMDLKIKNKNQTITLINEGEVNMLKSAGLTEISFDFFVPNSNYPFAINGMKGQSVLSALESLKVKKTPFQFVVIRGHFNTNMKMSVENYTVKEDSKNGTDFYISITLKQYRVYGTKKVKLPEKKEEKKVVENQPTRVNEKKKPYIGCEVIVNGTLHRDSYGKGPGKTLTNYRGKINFIKDRNHGYHVTDENGGWLGWVTEDSIQVV